MPLRSLLATSASIALIAGGSVHAQAGDPGERLSPVFVYGDRTSDQPGSVAMVDAETIATVDADHPAQILNELPGVNIQMNSGQEHLIALRSPVLTGGAGQGSFLILQNGLPTRSPALMSKVMS